MSQPALPLSNEKVLTEVNQTFDIKTTYTEEIIFGLCGPIGSPIHEVANIFKRNIEGKYRYKCHIIRLSDFIVDYMRGKGREQDTDQFKKLKNLIDFGNDMRKSFNLEVLAELAISKISMDREEHKVLNDSPTFKSRRVCYIIDSIKNIHEYKTFKNVYTDMFYLTGVFAEPEERRKTLNKSINEVSKVAELITQDSGEEIEHGQSVQDTFQLADFFIRGDNNEELLLKKIERFTDLIFGTKITTPSVDETAMYMAASAAGNSACLSRQVGACLTDINGHILSVGWNDVPKAGGGTYSSNDKMGEDQRCYNRGKCFNEENKIQITEIITEALIKEDVIERDKKEHVVKILKRTPINSLIEYSRSIHAEMLAIIQGAINTGNHIQNGVLYTTTYPCHFCAKHIIAAGIMKVFFIEPYPKSLALKLHDDAISETENLKKVHIIAFEGISPNKYLTFFKKTNEKRKDPQGKVIFVDPRKASPVYTTSLESIPIVENIIVRNLMEKNLIAKK